MHYKNAPQTPQDGFFQVFLEPLIGEENTVRVIAAFVDSLDLAALGFAHVNLNQTGAPPYDPGLLLKLYFYGYFNRIRSSRMLERECTRNVELWWLLERAVPSYHTIATFRTYVKKDEAGKVLFNHRTALVSVFKSFNQFCDQIGLFGKQTFATDGTKIAAQNSKKRHITEEKLKRKIERVDQRIEEYLSELDSEDHVSEQQNVSRESIQQALTELNTRKNNLLCDQKLLHGAQKEDPSITQICLTDPEARMLPINNEGMMQIAYNVQATVDDLHCLIADMSVENQKDLYLLSQMGASVKQTFAIETPFDLLADKGYHSAQGLHECTENNIITYVAFPEQGFKDKPKGFQKKDFVYDHQKDVYNCPNKQELKTTGTLHGKKGRQGHDQPNYKLYRCSFTICALCSFKDKCLSETNIKQRHGRTLERSEFEEAVVSNRKRIIAHREKYKRRQAIVEHPFGTIKRAWGAYYTLLRSKEKVAGEVAIVFTMYNLRRVINIFGAKSLINRLKRGVFVETKHCAPSRATLLCRCSKLRTKSAFGSGYLVASERAVTYRNRADRGLWEFFHSLR
jgi:transposase